ncbi:SigE family RNA polymerase sigma factor [Peterkaempfera griseoplana]|uniref:SigE family RNA polymerase sigma factor n=1 Tax=Peterkaempfera griseoplana TaxID=66896 RepID=UPI00099EC811|nr:SigE family RNA polymerase sigma factor [Peterkaempfera griseoplana]
MQSRGRGPANDRAVPGTGTARRPGLLAAVPPAGSARRRKPALFALAPAPVPSSATPGGAAVITPFPAVRRPVERGAAAPVDATAEGTSVDLLTDTYRAHYRSLLGLAALLLDDTASCEDVVQEAFIRVHAARRRVREPEKTLAYLRQTVVNLSRSALRRRILGLRLLPKPMPDMASAEEGAYEALERDQLKAALRGLQRRQREVLVLRYFADMTEAQVAEALGISVGSVKAYGSRGLATLRVRMEAQA